MIYSDKQQLRSAALAARQELTSEQRSDYSATIMKRLQQHLASQNKSSDALLAYRSMPSEVNTESLFASSQTVVFAPVTHHHEDMQWIQAGADSNWRQGVFGVLEPEGDTHWQGQGITTLLCPLSAFDRAGNRLGMGKGCFDYWLASHRKDIYQVIGLAFAAQEVAAVPAEEHDVPMDFVITEQEIITCLKR